MLVAVVAATGADAANGRQNVIIGYSGSDAAGKSIVAKYGGSVRGSFPSINAIAASLGTAARRRSGA